jgi:NADH-quinone oxidoreductase subunit L
MSLEAYGWLVIAFPLAGTLGISLLWPLLRDRGRTAGWIGTGAIALSFVAALAMLFRLEERGEEERQVVSSLFDYANTVGVDAQMAILVDPLSVFMALVVSGVSMLIHLYSVTYMASDRGIVRYFAYLNFFVFSMLVLVMAGSFLLLIVGWAFVGAASYLLISFWYRRRTATRAGIKAFVINVVGDVGLVLGTYFIFKHTGTLDYLATFEQAAEIPGGDLTAGLVLLLVGAFAKSAQIPFHTWLADAMEGPTPVSALIHAATMVTAGVYLIARMHPLFEQSHAAALVGAIVGATTLFVAATIGLAVTDIKRIIAWSTMSQIGYMVMAVSLGAYAAGMFHFMTHAFFKALLFMGAGSVIAAMAGAQDIDRMGGFRRAMPFTLACMVIGSLALAGIPPFSGFFSKDEILAFVASREGGAYWIFTVVGYLAALITAIYSFRLIFRVFFNEPVHEARELEQGHLVHAEQHVNPTDGEVEDTDVGFPGPEHYVAERERPMKVAMGTLAVLASIGGLALLPFGIFAPLEHFLEPTFADSALAEELHPSDGLTGAGLVIGAALGLLGILVAWTVWVRRPGTSAALAARFPRVHALLVNQWYFDQILDTLFVRPAAWFGRWASAVFERVFVEGTLVGGTTGLVRAGSAAVRAVQTGLLRSYVALLLVGMTAVGLYFLLQS